LKISDQFSSSISKLDHLTLRILSKLAFRCSLYSDHSKTAHPNTGHIFSSSGVVGTILINIKGFGLVQPLENQTGKKMVKMERPFENRTDWSSFQIPFNIWTIRL
jgi:hypothetical protein